MQRQIKPSTEKLEITRKYRRTKKGVVRNIYSHMLGRQREKGRSVDFTGDELLDWCFKQEKFHELFDTWAKEGYLKNLKPSVDRIDPLKGYFFDNIQILPYGENRKKGDKEKEILWGKPISQLTLDGVLIKNYPSTKQAVKETGLRQGLISSVLNGKRNHTGGYRFVFQHPELLNP